jgi:N utilization substance protein A
VVQELRGEKIDIVPYDRDPARYVIAAIQPAEVHKVIVDEPGGRMEIVVPDEKLSLAIGRKGQNVRLASQLTDWKLDVISESKFRKMEEEAVSALQCIDSVSESTAKSMYRMGFRALEEVAEAPLDELAGIPGIGTEDLATTVKTEARETMERLRKERVREFALREEPLTERERLLCVPSVGLRTLTLLEDAGYKSIASILKENEDRLGIRTGLGFKKATTIKEAVASYARAERELFEQTRAQLLEERAAAIKLEAKTEEGTPADLASAAQLADNDQEAVGALPADEGASK